MLSFNGVSWSLSVEAYFYLLFPLLLILFRRWGAPLLLLLSFLQGLCILALGEFFWGWPQEYGSFFPPCRLFEFALGMYACMAWRRRAATTTIAPWSEMLSLLVGIGFILGVGPFLWLAFSRILLAQWFLTEISALFFAWIIWAFAHHAGPISRLLSAPLAVQLGQVSFSLYMIHQVVLRYFLLRGYAAAMSPMGFFITYVTLSILGAYLLFYGVETPARHWIVRAYRRGTAEQPQRPTDVKAA